MTRVLSAACGCWRRQGALLGTWALAASLLGLGCAPRRTMVDRGPDPFYGLEPGWNQVKGGPATSCADGSPYSFFVRPGNPRRLTLIFQGGGACWSAATCDLSGARRFFDPTVDESDRPVNKDGILDLDEPRNPIRDHTVILVPYCTGDVHLGTRSARYVARDPAGAVRDVVVHHLGADNVVSVLEWIVARFPNLESVFVLGSSAGAISSPFYASLMAELYPEAYVVQLGDSAGGYRAESLPLLLAHWGATDRLRREKEFRSLSTSITFPTLYKVCARKSPLVVFSQVNSVHDSEQLFFLGSVGVQNVPLPTLLSQNLAEIRSVDPDFRCYLAPGGMHTILMRPEFYTLAVDGVAIRDWVADLVNEQPVRNVGESLLLQTSR
jgi:hypothetical protein